MLDDSYKRYAKYFVDDIRSDIKDIIDKAGELRKEIKRHFAITPTSSYSDVRDYINAMEKNGTPVVDCTYRIESLLREGVEDMKELRRRNDWVNYEDTSFPLFEPFVMWDFKNLVKSGGKYDVKNKSEWYYPYSKYLDGLAQEFRYPSLAPYIRYYQDEIWSAADFGNYAFGYYGAALYSEFILKAGAGAYQVYSGTADFQWLRTYFDDPKDQEMIEKGYKDYSRRNY